MNLPMATTVRPSDTSTSVVLSIPDTDPQIAPTEDGLEFREGIRYDGRAGRELMMDLFTHPSGGPKPLVVYVSGGGFMVSIRQAARAQRAYLARAGFVVASIDYTAMTHGPGVTFTDSVRDVLSAIGFLRANAAEFGIDPAHIGIWGESAGGYLAAMVGTTSDAVQAVVDNFGASSLPYIAEDFDDDMRAFWISPDGAVANYVFGPGGGVLDPADETVRRADPISHISPATPPFLLCHGDADRLVSPSQTLRLHTALRQAGVSSTRYVLAGAGHGDLTFLGDPDGGRVWTSTTMLDIVVEFLSVNLSR